MAEKDDTFSVPGLSRGIRIMELLAQRSDGLNQTEIAHVLGIPFASVSRITLQLEEMGYLRRDPESKAFPAHAASTRGGTCRSVRFSRGRCRRGSFARRPVRP